MANEKLTPIHPGEILLEEFLRPWASASTDWQKISMYPLEELMK